MILLDVLPMKIWLLMLVFVQSIVFLIIIVWIAKWDEESHFPVETYKRLAELGFGGIYINPDYGGSGLSRYFDSRLPTEIIAFDILQKVGCFNYCRSFINRMCWDNCNDDNSQYVRWNDWWVRNKQILMLHYNI